MGWRKVVIGLVLAAMVQPAEAQQQRPTPQDPVEVERAAAALASHTSPTLRQFESETAFRRYLDDVRAAARARRMWWSGHRRIQFALAGGGQSVQPQEPLCPPEDPNCVANQASESVVVTGARGRVGGLRASSSPANPSITNTQEVGVDEGDIVKQIGQFLLILQDGRIFVVDTQAGGGHRLVLTDRMNVYRNRGSGAWYDEMLVQDDRVVVTAYSYEQRASEISVFQLDRRGRLSRLGVFYMSSNDYYSADNYATRLVGDSLVVYTPMWLRSVRPGTPIPWPLIRRWTEGETREAALARGVRLFDATSIYRPVRTTFEPVVHTVSVCPLTPAGSGGNLDCRTTAFVGPAQREYYVSPDSAYLWITPGYQEMQTVREDRACADGPERVTADGVPALLYRLPLSGAAPTVIGTAGTPIDQFSLAEIDGRFRALLRWPVRCRERSPHVARHLLSYFSWPLARMGDMVETVPDDAFTAVPAVDDGQIENRFTDEYLVYGGRSTWDLGAAPRSDTDRRAQPSIAIAVPVDRPRDAVRLALPHSVVRAERAGDNIVLTGYRGTQGLELSLVDLRRRPRIASTARLEGRYESEGRSHAFNSLIAPDGSGIMGIPTVVRRGESGRYWWRSRASDLSYLRVSAAGQLTPVGELLSRVAYDTRNDEDGIPGYECEVSCIDWYGNSRPIFTDGRIFGLTGTELIEGSLSGREILEVRRINIALESLRLNR